MKGEHPISARVALSDRERVERACLAAARSAAKLHRFHNVPIVTARDNVTCLVSADEYDKMLDEHEARLNARFAKPKAGE
jgi:hypothetical protein